MLEIAALQHFNSVGHKHTSLYFNPQTYIFNQSFPNTFLKYFCSLTDFINNLRNNTIRHFNETTAKF